MVRPVLALLRDRRVVEVYDRRQLAGPPGAVRAKGRVGGEEAKVRDAARQRPRRRQHRLVPRKQKVVFVIARDGDEEAAVQRRGRLVVHEARRDVPRRRPCVVQPVHGPHVFRAGRHLARKAAPRARHGPRVDRGAAPRLRLSDQRQCQCQQCDCNHLGLFMDAACMVIGCSTMMNRICAVVYTSYFARGQRLAASAHAKCFRVVC